MPFKSRLSLRLQYNSAIQRITKTCPISFMHHQVLFDAPQSATLNPPNDENINITPLENFANPVIHLEIGKVITSYKTG